MKDKDIAMVINTASGKKPRGDEVKIGTAAIQTRIAMMATLPGAEDPYRQSSHFRAQR
jgi:carbamoyl-phosphate synthase large subunit